MRKAVVRATIAALMLFCAGTIIVTIWLFGYSKVEVWSTVAASLAVITALVSALTAQTLLEKQEEAQRPYPYPALDAYSRTHLFQLRVTNMGGGAAYDIRLNWKQPLLDVKGKPVRFSQRDPEIPLLLPNESVFTLIGAGPAFLSKYPDAEYSGEIEFKDSPTSNEVYKHDFYINIEMFRGLPVYTSEEQETHDKLQKLPGELSKIAQEIEKLRCDFEEAYKLTEEEEVPMDKGLAAEFAAKGLKPPD